MLVRLLQVLDEEVLWEEMTLQEGLKDRDGGPCSDSTFHRGETTNGNGHVGMERTEQKPVIEFKQMGSDPEVIVVAADRGLG